MVYFITKMVVLPLYFLVDNYICGTIDSLGATLRTWARITYFFHLFICIGNIDSKLMKQL